MTCDEAGKPDPARYGIDQSDTGLALALCEHSPGALAEAFRRHGGAVVGHARSRCGDTAVAEDITQEVFLALWRNPTRFDPARGSLRTYLLTLARHRTIDLHRSEQARTRRQDRVFAEAESEPSTEDAIVVADDAVRVRHALNSLPREEQLAIDLAFFEHHTYREVAQILGKPEGTIKGRIRAGLQRLRSSPELARVMGLAGAEPSLACEVL